MLDPKSLISAARVLIGRGSKGAPSQARLRRAVSTAYYALFHAMVARAADTFVGTKHRSSAGYETVYRSFEHRAMKQGCESVDKPTISDKAKRAMGASYVSPEIRDVANAFVTLQERRHRADYAPADRFTRSDAEDVLELALFGIGQLGAASSNERRDFLAYLMCGSRL